MQIADSLGYAEPLIPRTVTLDSGWLWVLGILAIGGVYGIAVDLVLPMLTVWAWRAKRRWRRGR